MRFDARRLRWTVQEPIARRTPRRSTGLLTPDHDTVSWPGCASAQGQASVGTKDLVGALRVGISQGRTAYAVNPVEVTPKLTLWGSGCTEGVPLWIARWGDAAESGGALPAGHSLRCGQLGGHPLGRPWWW
jgi:hypothetical protein